MARALLKNKFKGVYVDGEKYPKLKAGEGIIINRKENEHWVSTANIGGKKYTYDSFNRKEYLGGYHTGDFDGIVDQKLHENSCGQRCISWLMTVLE